MPRYRIVPERSCVWIEARSSLHPIHAATDGLEGYLEMELGPEGDVDLAVTPAAKLSLAVSRLSSGNRMEDRELQKRIDSRRYPTIEGVMDQMEPSSEAGSYGIGGNITFRGVSRRHNDRVTVRALDSETIHLEGRSRFDVRDFGMEPPRMLMLKVEPEVDVRVEILAVREG